MRPYLLLAFLFTLPWLEIQGDFSSRMGRGQAVLHDSNPGVNYGASDPRADGSAVPEPPRIPAAK
jgi:hypothetical protein